VIDIDCAWLSSGSRLSMLRYEVSNDGGTAKTFPCIADQVLFLHMNCKL